MPALAPLGRTMRQARCAVARVRHRGFGATRSGDWRSPRPVIDLSLKQRRLAEYKKARLPEPAKVRIAIQDVA